VIIDEHHTIVISNCFWCNVEIINSVHDNEVSRKKYCSDTHKKRAAEWRRKHNWPVDKPCERVQDPPQICKWPHKIKFKSPEVANTYMRAKGFTAHTLSVYGCCDHYHFGNKY